MIKVLFFARLQEETGKNSLEIEKAGLTVDQLKQWLEKEHGLPSLDHTMAAVNEDYADGSEVLEDGDTVALIPPVSGG
ncbi:molybdopterin converting factor subunit 1 [Alteribacillus sp. JSM 102045]|uniref:molybdopterin converting factor subunit 1 n=1 Tax=Alteribacillus sp. JSM 102045 TaxID=1562101 RepID=UPI0035C0CA92